MSTSARTCGRRLMAWVMALVLCLGLLPGAALAAEEPTYAKVTSADQFTTGTYYMVTNTGYAPGKLDGNWISAVQVAEGTIPDAIWTLTVTGEEVTLKDSNGKFVAPKGGNNNGIKEGEYKWNWSFEDGKFTFAGQGDDTVVLASNKSSENKFRAYKTSTVSGYPNSYPSEFTLYKADDASLGGEVTVAAPQANPQAGAVASGTEITLTCTTAGAEIYYTLDGSDPSDGENVNRKLYSEDNQPTITENCTLKAVAVLGGVSSAVQTLEYTVKTESTAPIANGDQVVIYAPAYNKALSSEKTGHYNVGTDITVEADGTVTGYGASDIWTVVANEDGTYSFQQGDQNIGLGDSYASMDLGAVNDDWKLIDLGNGLYNIQNTVRGNYMEWYAQYSNWSTYNSNSVATDDKFQLSFYKVTGETPDPEPSEAPFEANDTIVIYAPSNNRALSATVKNDYYPIGVEVDVEGGTITGYGATEVWTVGGEDGAWTFSNGGKSLSMGNEHTSTYPGAGENETWVLEPAKTEGQYYVKNVVRGTYLWWDDTYDDWNTRDNDKTAVTFAVVEPPEEEPDVSGLEVRATPASGASVEAGDTIELTAAAGAEIYYTTDGTAPTKNSTHYESPITLGSGEGQVPAPTDDKSLVIKAISVATNEEGEEEIGDVCTFTYQAPVTLNGYNLYFGQLHAHTNISDGAGSVTEAFQHASQVENLDFLAVTDHSNSFDNESDSQVDLGADLTNVSDEWKQGHEAAAAVTGEDFVGLYGFEMTWSDGFGHINTFNTPGFESRSNSEFGNKSGSTEGYQNYYKKLVEVGSSLSQFNHPGTTFGDFQDFAFYDPQVDQRITLIEVGNGEGAIGSSGYFPSYEYYTRALDKGWHVAPTNNQDNHKGNWGDSNTARSVVLADDLTEKGIYDAIRNYRVYATEDNDLSILYSLNGNAMGSILNKQESGVTLTAQITDPTDPADMKVEVIVNGGLVIGSQTLSGGSGTVTFTFDSNDYSYYYLRVTQADQNIAVTAPVWTGEGVNAGISKTECDTALVVKGEEVTISSELYNNAGSDMTVESLTFSVDGIEKPIYTANVSQIGTNGVIYSGGSYTVSFPYAFTQAGKATVDVSMTATIGETEYTFAGVLQLTVTDESLVTRVLVDGTHWNDYVTGYYADRMGNFAQLAADMNAQVTIKQPGETITADDLENVSLLVVSAPLKRTGSSNTADGAEPSTFSSDFITMVADYAKKGGTVILCGLADYQDSSSGAPYCSTEQINPILEAMGSTLRLNDDEVLDDDTSYNGGATQTYRVYMDDFNVEAFPELFEGIQEGQRYSAYSGCSVSLGENGVALVRGSDNCYSINSNERPEGAKGQWDSGKPEGSTASGSYDAKTAVVQKGDVVTLATETVGEGRVYVAGTVFLSNFEISDSSSVDYGDASYANKTILENILSGLLKEQTVSKIADVRANNTAGKVFTVEGTVTAGNIEPNAFYDTIYIQDATGGINIYPVATTDGTFRVGQQVQVTGSWDQYQGDTELRCISIEALGSELNPIKPTELDISDVDYANNGGLLAQVGGTVKSVVKKGDAISSVTLTDGTSDFRLLFNNYIGYSDESSPNITTFVKEGAEISAVGVIYMDPEGVCLRVRDLSEVQLVEDKPSEPEDPNEPDVPVNPNPSYAITVEQPDHGTVTADPAAAKAGAKVTLTATPDEGYAVGTITVTDRFGDAVKVTENADGTYTFTMPNGQVTVKATFVETEEPAPAMPFTDVKEGDWFYEEVLYAYENGLMNGVGDNRFAPNSATTRGMLVTILYRLEGEPAVTGEAGFDDVGDTWYTDAVIWAAANDIVNGIGDNQFGPENTLTREQLVTMLYRYAQNKGYDVTASADLSGYPDAGQIQSWAQDAMTWAVAEGIVEGMDGNLNPAGHATRAQIATILMRFCEGVAK
ncbi:CehA/McbA family metallohydrolase [Evtepia sp.]|uniref:CehA/McbA family metallohydrolase n=1 Tax=Evtepia sp. TaxID=2773933 RepID=UPI00399A72B0